MLRQCIVQYVLGTIWTKLREQHGRIRKCVGSCRWKGCLRVLDAHWRAAALAVLRSIPFRGGPWSLLSRG